MPFGRSRSFLDPCDERGKRIACSSSVYCGRTKIEQPMTIQDDAAQAEILARLAASREELRRLLDRTRDAADADGSTAEYRPGPGGFPRSRTMQMLMSGRGLGTLGAAAAGLLIARPGLALRLLRILPAGAVAKTLLVRTIAALRTKPEHGPR